MPKTEPFEKYYREYDAWFEQNEKIYESELLAIRELLPDVQGKAVEIGVGSGRFASKLGIKTGVEPAEGIANLARKRGIEVIKGRAEDLPLKSGSYQLSLLSTTICFVDDIHKTFQEAYRILTSGGYVIVAFIPKESEFGKLYRKIKNQDKFFKIANFYTKKKIMDSLKEAGFSRFKTVQTLIGDPQEANRKVQQPIKGDNRGSFVVIRGTKKE